MDTIKKIGKYALILCLFCFLTFGLGLLFTSALITTVKFFCFLEVYEYYYRLNRQKRKEEERMGVVEQD